MENEYKYYLTTIKPIENKYKRICNLYNIFKCKSLKNKKKFYNHLLIFYYKTLCNNKSSQNIFKHLK